MGATKRRGKLQVGCGGCKPLMGAVGDRLFEIFVEATEL